MATASCTDASSDAGAVAGARAAATRPILHLINGEHYSGAERVQDLLAMRLPEFGYDVTLVCLKPGRFPEARRSKGARLLEMPMRGQADVRPAWRLARLLREGRYALVHAHTPRAALVGRIASALARVPLVYHVHSPAARDSTQRARNGLGAAVERLCVGRAAALVAVSDSLGEWMREQGYSSSPLAVVHNGVPQLSALPRRQPPAVDWTIGTIALFRPRKGLEVLLEALAILRSHGLAARLRAVGTFETPDYEAAIRRRVAQLGLQDDIDWTGFRHDVDRELAQMDLFVLPSLFGEGLPMVVLEAMAAGVPVVATRVEGVGEAIRDSLDGLLVEPGDSQGLAEKIERVIRGDFDWTALRASAQLRQAQHFSDWSMAAGVARVYDRLLGNSANSAHARNQPLAR